MLTHDGRALPAVLQAQLMAMDAEDAQPFQRLLAHLVDAGELTTSQTSKVTFFIMKKSLLCYFDTLTLPFHLEVYYLFCTTLRRLFIHCYACSGYQREDEQLKSSARPCVAGPTTLLA